MKHLLSLFVIALCVYPHGAVTSAFAQVDDAYLARLEVAKQVQDARPVRAQVDDAIDRYLLRLPEDQREEAGQLIREIINYDALEKISLDAYTEVYTEQELRAMYEYYSKPESRSAAAKTDQYADKVFPEIVRMLDRAIMRARTGG